MENKHITVNELFSGIGAQRKALERLGIDHEVVGICEIDKYAIQSYEAIFGKTYNYGDICTAPRLEYADLWTYSFPCQDISVAGKQQGINQNTRSGLLYQVQRLLEVAKDEGTLPKYLLLENVKNLVGKKFKSQFDDWLFYLDELGYDTYWQVLNAKNYGIPQNRERVFAISIRKDLNQDFEFPKAEELKIRLKDVLEDVVDDKFYLSDKCIQGFLKHNENHEAKGTGFLWKPRDLDGYASCLRATGALAPTDNTIVEKVIAASRGQNPDNPSDRTVSAPTITSSKYEHNNFVVSMYNPYNKAKLYDVAPAQTTGNRNTTSSSSVLVVEAKVLNPLKDKTPYGWHFEQAVYDSNGIARAVKAGGGSGNIPKVIENIRIRKLTPLECWRLMGFDDEDFYKAQKSGVSNSQLYKQAGNSIVVNVLEKIFKNLL